MLYQRGKTYSQDLRERVFATSDDGERVGEVAELLRVSVAYVSKALMRRRTTGETTVRAQRGHKVPKLAQFYAAIRAYVAERGDTTIAELRTWLLATHQVAASVGLIWHTLKLLGLSLKTYGPPRLQGRFHRACWSASTYPVTGLDPWPRWNARASGLIKFTVSGTTFLTRLPKRRLDRYAICFSPPQTSCASPARGLDAISSSAHCMTLVFKGATVTQHCPDDPC
jgi:transposase